jgi:hypothetical protein
MIICVVVIGTFVLAAIVLTVICCFMQRNKGNKNGTKVKEVAELPPVIEQAKEESSVKVSEEIIDYSLVRSETEPNRV